MLWAIIKLYKDAGSSLTLKELIDQKIIVLHFITLMVYLTALIFYYVYFAMWDSKDSVKETKVFVAWTVVYIMLTAVQLVLVYLFWGLSKPSCQDKSADEKISFHDDKQVNTRRVSN